MRQAMNFRFTTKTVTTLQKLEEEFNMSRTSILEDAVQYYAKKMLTVHSELLQFAGKLSPSEGMAMLKKIKSSRKNKNKEIKL